MENNKFLVLLNCYSCLNMRKTLKKLCEILSKSFFDGVAKDFHLISVHLYIITKKMYGEVPVGGLNSTPLP